MAQIPAINNDDDLAAAVARVDELFKANPDILTAGADHPEYIELNAIADLVLAYEDLHYPIPDPPPGAFIEYELERLALPPEALIPAIDSREVVAEALAGRQEVTPEMAAALYELLGIEVRDLLPAAAGMAAGC